MVEPERFHSPLALPIRNGWIRKEVKNPHDVYYSHEGTRNFSLAEFEKDKAYFIDELAKSKMKFQNFYFKNLARQAVGCDSGALGQALWLEVTYKSELSKVDTLEKFKVFADKLMKVLIDGEKHEKEI